MLEFLAEAARHGAATVAVTSFPRSALADLADFDLLTGARETTLRRGALSVVHSQPFVIDALYVATAQHTHERTADPFGARLRRWTVTANERL